MKVLWITNTLFPAVCNELNIPVPHVGGWMFSGAKHLLENNDDVKLSVATLYSGKELKKITLDGINYFLLPSYSSKNKYNKKLERYWREIENEIKPDVVHIHGSEYPHGLAYVRACGNHNVVLSVQGLVSVIERYYYAGISKKELRKNTTIRDIIRSDSILDQHRRMKEKGLYEKEIIKAVKHIIGRTSWDNAHIWSINPNVQYHFCNEILRKEFYNKEWVLNDCEKHLIFLSQSQYPLKGIHQMLKAFPLILKHYPQSRIMVAGKDFIASKKGLRLNGYSKYIRSLMQKLNITDKVIFTGILDEKQMSEHYLKANVFVSPSSIENSSNSIGEAQLVGVPCVASFVGGTSDMVENKVSGLLYRFEEVEMLAKSVCEIFSEENLATKLSVNERAVARHRHDVLENTSRLYAIYKKICES